MSRWTGPGLSPEERAREVLRGTIGGPTATVVAAAIRAAVEEERRRCVGVANAVAAESLEASSAARARSDVLTHLQRRDTALTIATRIESGEGGNEMNHEECTECERRFGLLKEAESTITRLTRERDEARKYANHFGRISEAQAKSLSHIVDVVHRYHPAGSPPSGDETVLTAWVLEQMHARATAAEARARDVVQRAAVLVEMADLFWDRGDPRKRIAASIRALLTPTTDP